MKKYLITTLFTVGLIIAGNIFVIKTHADTCGEIDLSKPPKVVNATKTWGFMNDNLEVKVNLDWATPDLIGYTNKRNKCMTAKNKYAEKVEDRPLSDYNYLIKNKVDGKTYLVTEENSNGLTKLNSGGSFFEIMRTPDEKTELIYEIRAYNKSSGTSDSVEVKVVIDPDPDQN